MQDGPARPVRAEGEGLGDEAQLLAGREVPVGDPSPDERAEMQAAGQCILRTVTEDEALAAGDFSGPQQMCDVAVEANFPQTNNDAQLRQQGNLLVQKRRAIFNFFRQRFIAAIP